MKINKFFLFALIAIATSLMFISCDDTADGYHNNYVVNAVVTIKPINNGEGFNIWVSDKVQGQATNLVKSPYGNKEVRALANIRDEGKAANGMQKIYVNWLDSIRTKQTVSSVGEKEDIKKYGDDPLEIVKDFTTVVEDGYLTLRFQTVWGNLNTKHELNLITGVSKDDPYKLVLRHNAKGDVTGRRGDGIIAFRLREIDKIAKEKGKKEVPLQLYWKSFNGEKHISFTYHTRDDKS